MKHWETEKKQKIALCQGKELQGENTNGEINTEEIHERRAFSKLGK